MAVKVVDLPAETGPTEDDLLVIRDNNTGTTRKITIADFLNTFTYRFVPTGSVVAFGGGTIPSGYLACDGSAVDRTTYASLFAVIGTNFGPGNGVDTFNLPDLRGRVVVGKAASGTFNTINNSGGTETELLTVDQIPSHTHGHNNPSHAHGVSDPGHSHNLRGFNANYPGGAGGAEDGVGVEWTRTFDTRGGGITASGTGIGIHASGIGLVISATGGGQAHNNLQPYRVLNYMIKV
jgi:microcystin-dependent protein